MVRSGLPASGDGPLRAWLLAGGRSNLTYEVSDGTPSWVVRRPLVRKAAWLMDTQGNKVAHSEIQAIKIATPLTVEWILDKAI